MTMTWPAPGNAHDLQGKQRIAVLQDADLAVAARALAAMYNHPCISRWFARSL